VSSADPAFTESAPALQANGGRLYDSPSLMICQLAAGNPTLRLAQANLDRIVRCSACTGRTPSDGIGQFPDPSYQQLSSEINSIPALYPTGLYDAEYRVR